MQYKIATYYNEDMREYWHILCKTEKGKPAVFVAEERSSKPEPSKWLCDRRDRGF